MSSYFGSSTLERIAELKAELAELEALAGPKVPRRGRDRLTDRKIATLKIPGFYADGDRLYLDHKSPPSKYFVVRYTGLDGKSHDLGLGLYPAVSLGEARRRRDQALALLRSGVDPVEDPRRRKLAARIEQRRVMTFAQCARAFIRANEAAWRNAKHAKQWPATLQTYAYPVLGDLPVDAIETPHILQVLQPIWQDRTETASRVRARIESVLAWAATAGHRPADRPNPARWRHHLENVLPARVKIAPVVHHRAMSYAELPPFMAELAAKTGLAHLALRFLILTTTRTGETLGVRWGEVDEAKALWTIPPERMKGKREHRVPLAPAALEVLAVARRLPPSPFVFAANQFRHIADNSLLAALRRMGRGATTHGFRSAFADWCAETTSACGGTFGADARCRRPARHLGRPGASDAGEAQARGPLPRSAPQGLRRRRR